MIQQFLFKEKYQTVKNKRFNKVYGGLPIKLVYFRHLRLKTNGYDQNSKRQKIN